MARWQSGSSLGYYKSMAEAVIPQVQAVPITPPGGFGGGPSIGVSTGVHGAQDKAHSATLAVGLKVYLAPVIELIDYLIARALPTEFPSIPEAIDCTLMQTVDSNTAQCWSEFHGQDWLEWQPVIDARRERMSDIEIIQWLRRNNATMEQQADALQRQGWFRRDEAEARVNLYDELPSIQDHLHWLQRNVFDEKYVEEFQLDEGFDTRFWPAFGHDLTAMGYTKYRAEKDYQAHWINPAPEQLKEMVYRLDPEIYNGPVPFTIDQYARVLQEQDVGAFFRPRFAEIAYRIPALGYIRDMYRGNVFGEEQLYKYHRQLGYAKADSDNFVAIDKLLKARFRASQSGGWTTHSAAKAFVVKQISEEYYYAIFTALGYSKAEANDAHERAQADFMHAIYTRARSRALTSIVTDITAAINTGVMTVDQASTNLIDAGWPDDFARSLATSAQVKAQVSRISKAINRIKRAFDSGEVDVNYVQAALPLLGVTVDNVQSYIAIWQLELTPNRKRRSATQIVNDVANNMMSIGEAVTRLNNLGYNNADQMLFLADARRKIEANESKLLSQAERLSAKRQREIEKIANEAKRQQKEAIAELRREEPPAKLQKWAELGEIDKDYFYRRMRLYDFDDQSITLWWEEACAKKNAACNGSQTVPEGQPIGSAGSTGISGLPNEPTTPVP